MSRATSTIAASSALIVYGTGRTRDANRYAAEQVQKRLYGNYESAVPIRKDFEVDGRGVADS